MIVHFGKNFNYTFYPLSSDGKGFETLPSTAESIFLFNSLPSLEQAGTGLNSIATLPNTLAPTVDTLGKIIAVPAISEPADIDVYTEVKYYLAINVKLQVGANTHTLIRELKIRKLTAQEININLLISDVLAVEPSLSKFCSCVGDLQSYINASLDEIRAEINHINQDWRTVQDPTILKPLIILLAISKFYYSLSRSPNDIYFVNGERYYEMYEKRKKITFVEFDKGQLGATSVTKQYGASYSMRIRR